MECWHKERVKFEGFGRNILYNIDAQEEIPVHICGFGGIWRGNCFEGELIGRAEVEVGVGKLRNGKGKGKDNITG